MKLIKSCLSSISFAFLLCCINIGSISAQSLDSLKEALKTEKNPIAKLKILGKITDKSEQKEIVLYSNQSLDIIQNLSPELKEKNKTTLLIEEARAYRNLSFYFYNVSLYSKSEDNAMSSILILEKNHLDTSILTSAYNNLASVYLSLKNYEKAISIFKKNLVFDLSLKDSSTVAIDYMNISSAFGKLNKRDSAIYYAKKSISINEKLDRKLELVNSYRLLGMIYLDENYVDSAQLYINRGFNYAIQLKDTSSFQLIYYAKAMSEKKLGNTKVAEDYFLQALAYSKQSNYLVTIYNSHYELYKIYDASKNYAKALFHFKQYKLFQDSAISVNIQKDSEIKQVKFDATKREIELEAQRDEERAVAKEKQQRDRLIIWFAVFSIVLIAVFLLFVLNRARLLRKQQKQIVEQRDLLFNQQEELVVKNQLLDKKNTTITENINYAQNIQNSLIPSEKKISTLLKRECFVIFQPKDIVSGDFYWSFAKNNKQLLILADCTGHGVSGAFISILAIKSLEKVVSEMAINDLEGILKQLHKDFLLTFSENTNDHFGIELVLCCFDNDTNNLLITGSSNSVCIVNKGELSAYQFDSISIGTVDARLENIKTYSIEIQEKSSIYLFTDGYYDQKGGPSNKKYLSKKLKTTLTEIANLPIEKQKQILEKNYSDWKSDHEQIDDVSLIGINW